MRVFLQTLYIHQSLITCSTRSFRRSNPIPCPPGTYANIKQLAAESECMPCKEGFVCPDSGTVNPTVPCAEGFYCPPGQLDSLLPCLLGHYCPQGSHSSIPCPPGSYADALGSKQCKSCPPRKYCVEGTINPSDCEAYVTRIYMAKQIMQSFYSPCLEATFVHKTLRTMQSFLAQGVLTATLNC